MNDGFDLTKLFTKSGWRIKPKLSGDPRYAEYVKRMAEAQRILHPPKPKPIKPEHMTMSEWVVSLQEPSTKEIIEKQKDPNYKRDWSEPLPDNVLAKPNATSLDELVDKRVVTKEEAEHWYATRPKNTLGQSEASAFTEEARDRASHAFIVSPPARLTNDEIDQVTNLTNPAKGIPASLPEYEWKKLTTWQAIKHWLKGGKVRRE